MDILYDGGQTYMFFHDGGREQRVEAITTLMRWEKEGLIAADAAYLLLSRLATVAPADLVRQEVRRG